MRMSNTEFPSTLPFIEGPLQTICPNNLKYHGFNERLVWMSTPEASGSPNEGRMFHERVKQPRGATFLCSQHQQ